jgi:hypothetical protein
MSELLFQLFARTLPSLVSVILSSQSFNRFVMVLSIQSFPSACPDFERQQRNGFPCVRLGATVLSICLSTIGPIINYFITALLLSDPLLKTSIAAASALLAASLFFYLLSYGRELFMIKEAIGLKHRWLGEHVAFMVSLIHYLCCITVNAVALVYH